MAASITDVARRAGVSVATVSRALRGLPNVAEGTRQRVLEAAHELEYVADRNAARLATGRSRSVAVVVGSVSRWYCAHVVAGAERVLAEAGYDVLLVQTEGARGQVSVASLAEWRKRADGVLLVALSPRSRVLATLRGGELPTVVVGGRVEGLSWVGVDDRAAAATATRHLVNLGHERIGLVGGSPGTEDGQAAARRAGYRDALRSAGLDLDRSLEVAGGHDVESGADAMARLLTVTSLPTAVFATNDEMALGAIRTIHAAGLRVPEDVSLIGFDDHELAGCTGLTTMHQPSVQIGESAAAVLLERMTSTRPGEAQAPPTSVTVPTKLRIRTTTAPSRRLAAARSVVA